MTTPADLVRDARPDSSDDLTAASQVDRCALLREAAAALVAKLDACLPYINSMHAMEANRGMVYSGPTLHKELEALRATLVPVEESAHAACEHKWVFDGIGCWPNDQCLPGPGIRPRHIVDCFYCERCHEQTTTNDRFE